MKNFVFLTHTSSYFTLYRSTKAAYCSETCNTKFEDCV